MTKKSKLRIVMRNYQVYLMILPCLIYIIIFAYVPMYGVQIAFKDYNTGLGIWGSPWVGFKHFKYFIFSKQFYNVVRNTLLLSLYTLLVGFPLPIILAISLNEMRSLRYKKLIQTVTYAPHFISTVVMASMVTLFLSPSAGFINKFIEATGSKTINFMSKPSYFPHIYVWSGIWQHIGWSSIIYVAGLAGIDSELHEAAMIDGATRFQRIWHINLPGIIPMIVIQLILTMGGLLGSDFEKVLLLQNPSIMESADVLSTYTYRIGIQGGKFSLSAAIGLFGSVVNFILIIAANFVSSKLGETSLW